MIETPKITQFEAQPTAIIHLEIPRKKMQEVFGPAIEELMAAVAEQGIEVTGPVFAHHLKMDRKFFDFEVGVPVAEPVAPSGRIEPSEVPSVKVAQTVYHGPYEGLAGAWSEFHDWLEENDHTWGPDVWERYVVSPDADPDPKKWRTELNRPLID